MPSRKNRPDKYHDFSEDLKYVKIGDEVMIRSTGEKAIVRSVDKNLRIFVDVINKKPGDFAGWSCVSEADLKLIKES